MSDITIRCRICWLLPTEPHAPWCPAPEPAFARAPEPTPEEAPGRDYFEGILAAWRRGEAMPNAPRGGYRPKDEPELP